MKRYRNIIQEVWERRYKTLSQETIDKIEKMYEGNPDDYQLEVIKRKRITPQKGDVFVVKPRNGIYFFGVVINSGIQLWDMNDVVVVLIFKNRTDSLTKVDFVPDYNNLLLRPCIVSKYYWNKGYFFNTGQKVDIPSDLDYGFFDSLTNQYKNEYDEFIDREPCIAGMHAIYTYIGIAYDINIELYIDNSLYVMPGKTIPELKGPLNDLKNDIRSSEEIEISPFHLIDNEVFLNVSDYPELKELFLSREEEGFIGNGYDWESLATVYLEEICEERIQESIEFDSEAQFFRALSEDENDLKEFIIGFHNACKDMEMMKDLFSRAEIN